MNKVDTSLTGALVRLAAVLCLCNASSFAQSCVPAGTSVAAVTNRIIESIEKLQSPDASSAQVIEGMKSSLKSLTDGTVCFQAKAQQGHDQCIGQVGRFTLTLANFETAEKQLSKRLAEWDVDLERAVAGERVNEAALRKIQTDMENTRRALENRRREMKKYDWMKWVCPPCKLIAEAITNDEANIRRLESDMRALQVQGQPLQASREQLVKAKQDAIAALASIKATTSQVEKIRGGIHQELGDLKATTAFLTEANVFWRQVGQILTIQAGPQLASAARDSRRKLDATTGPVSFSAGAKAPAATLKETLLRFAKATDDGSNFLLKADAAFCAVGSHDSIYGPTMVSSTPARIVDKTVYITAYGLENRSDKKSVCTFTPGDVSRPIYTAQPTTVEPRRALKVDDKVGLARSYYRPIKPDSSLTPSAAEIAAYPGWKQPDGFSLSCNPQTVYAYVIYQDR
jgi:hypothetical protein